MISISAMLSHFNPPAPCGAGLCGRKPSGLMCSFQSTRPMRGGTNPRTEVCIADYISIHPPHAGRDPEIEGVMEDEDLFQSTRPMRGGTIRLLPQLRGENDFNPPAPCGAGLVGNGAEVVAELFQSTRPVRGGTHKGPEGPKRNRFQSTRPVRGGTKSIIRRACSSSISIHPPRAGRDHKVEYDSEWVESFQSTRPVRGGTRWMT